MRRTAIVVSSLFLGIAAWAAGGSLVQRAAERAGERDNPFAGAESDRLAGAKLYERECAECHGMHRQGRGKAPALGQSEVYSAPSGVLFWAITNGSLRRGMPSFAHLPEPQRWQIITYLQKPEAQ